MKIAVAPNGVRFYYSEKIPCPHGFSTRIGGVSQLADTATLNLGVDRGDSLSVVLQNLALFGEAVGFEAEDVISVGQIHSDHLRYVTEEHCGEGFFQPATEACDGYVTDQKRIVLGVRTADCVPILFYGKTKEGKECIAAVHAGWRGTVQGIALRALENFDAFGVMRDTVRIAIGPAIGSCCYEVKEDFLEAVRLQCGEHIADQSVFMNEQGAYFADVRMMNRLLLGNAGIPEEHMDISDVCTCCSSKEFFSHRFSRFSNFRRGSMLSVITLGN